MYSRGTELHSYIPQETQVLQQDPTNFQTFAECLSTEERIFFTKMQDHPETSELVSQAEYN